MADSTSGAGGIHRRKSVSLLASARRSQAYSVFQGFYTDVWMALIFAACYCFLMVLFYALTGRDSTLVGTLLARLVQSLNGFTIANAAFCLFMGAVTMLYYRVTAPVCPRELARLEDAVLKLRTRSHFEHIWTGIHPISPKVSAPMHSVRYMAGALPHSPPKEQAGCYDSVGTDDTSTRSASPRSEGGASPTLSAFKEPEVHASRSDLRQETRDAGPVTAGSHADPSQPSTPSMPTTHAAQNRGLPGRLRLSPDAGTNNPDECTRHTDVPQVDIVLVHGHSSGAALWSCVADELCLHCSAVHLLDMPGWGRTPLPQCMRGEQDQEKVLEFAAGSVLSYLDERGLAPESTVLVGHSMGAAAVALLARKHPSRVRQVILCSPGAVVPCMARNVGWALCLKYLTPYQIARWSGSWGASFGVWLYEKLSGEHPEYPPLYYQLGCNTLWQGAGDDCARKFVQHSATMSHIWWSRPVLREILALKVPVSVLWGEHDEIFPVDHGKMLAHVLGNKTDLYVVKGAEHNPAHTDSAAVGACIGDAVRKTVGAPRLLCGPQAAAARRTGRSNSSGSRSSSESDSDGVEEGNAAQSSGSQASNMPRNSAETQPKLGRHTGMHVERLAPGPAWGTDEMRLQAACVDAPAETSGSGNCVEGQAGSSCRASGAALLGRDRRSRGRCVGCGHMVEQKGAEWRCGCAAWAFTMHPFSRARTEESLCLTERFLCSLLRVPYRPEAQTEAENQTRAYCNEEGEDEDVDLVLPAAFDASSSREVAGASWRRNEARIGAAGAAAPGQDGWIPLVSSETSNTLGPVGSDRKDGSRARRRSRSTSGASMAGSDGESNEHQNETHPSAEWFVVESARARDRTG